MKPDADVKIIKRFFETVAQKGTFEPRTLNVEPMKMAHSLQPLATVLCLFEGHRQEHL